MTAETGPIRAAVLDDYQGVAPHLADWDTLGGVKVDFFRDRIVGADALVERLGPYGIVVAMRERTPFPASILTRLPSLRLLVTTGPYNATIDVAAAREQGITVTGTGYSASDTAELTWGLLLAVQRHIVTEDRAVRTGHWQTTLGTTLAGKRLGILGLGNLGKRVARVGHAFEMDVVAWSQNLTAERAAEAGVRRIDRHELFGTADVISIHLVLSDRTRGLVGSSELEQMKPTAILVNTSLGPIVDEKALAEALERRTIAGAGVDVYSEEPMPEGHPLRRAPNTVLTGHVGFVTRECYEIFFRDVVEDIAAFLSGEPIRVIN